MESRKRVHSTILTARVMRPVASRRWQRQAGGLAEEAAIVAFETWG